MIQVTFDCTAPETHLVRVTQVIPPSEASSRTFRMAAWVPGSYKIRDFGRHVQDVEATVDGKNKKVTQTGKDAWSVKGVKGKSITIQFDVYCRELTVDTSHVTSDHAHLFPATVVLYDDDTRSLPHKISIKKPRGWSVYSGLETGDFDGTLEVAKDYDHLIDCPIEIAPAKDMNVQTFTVRNKKHRLVTWMAPTSVDWERITKDVKAVVAETSNIFGGLPYEHYSFITHVAANHGGGLEHRNSTILGVDPLALIADDQIKERFLPLVAHEFFHTWNVKRILPAEFQPYDLQNEVYTDLLWLFEGFTTYYELPILRRANVVDDVAFGKIAVEMLKYYEMALGRKRRSVSECSRLTWTLLYQPHEHNVNRNVSYYTKGLFVGLCLDWHLRVNGVKEGLDVVMRHMWKTHGNADGVEEDGFPAIVMAATGVDVKALLNRWVHGTTELPVDKAFKELGWDLSRDHPDPKATLGLGVAFKADSSIIERIPEEAPAWKVLQPDDELVAVNGYKWSGKRFSKLANAMNEGDEVEITVFREGRLRMFHVPLQVMPKDKYSLKVRKDAKATRLRKAWLGS